ncbi:DUF3565 domain-containing protein [Pseudomonas lalucatii]|nr:DUF3565 domain-containing protein [Pseudomonas lalucatii]
MKNERTSVTKATPESDPSPAPRQTGGAVRLLDLRQDEDGHWVAVLSCGHTQHLRHQPPWQNRAWVLDPAQRDARRGQRFRCGWCLNGARPAPPPADETR